MSCECKCKFDGRKRNSVQWWNNSKCRFEWKKSHLCEKDYIQNPATCCCENGKKLVYSTNFDEKKATCITPIFYILLVFILITIALLIAVSICCYLIKYRVKQKHLLPSHKSNNELKEVMY